jgi:hypothetical protein
LSNAGQVETRAAPGAPAVTTATGDPRIESIRQHLARYRDLASQGKWSDAGRELDAIQSEVQK